MGFTGSLVLARTPVPLTDLNPLAGHDAELVGRRADHWQLAAVTRLTRDHHHDTADWVAALVDATLAPVLIADVIDSDTALLLADSPGGNRWSTVLTALGNSGPWATATARTEAIAATIDVVLAWANEAEQAAATAEAVTEALCAADRDNRAADQAMLDAAGDLTAMAQIVRNHVSFIEVYVLRVLAALGLAVPVLDGSFWTHLANQTHTPFSPSS